MVAGHDGGFLSRLCRTNRLFGVELVFRPGLVEGRKLHERGVGRDELGKRLERRLQPPRIIHLRHKINVGERHLAAEAIRTRLDHLLPAR